MQTCHVGIRNPAVLCVGVCCWEYKDITCQSVGLCVILANPANMNESGQAGGGQSHGAGQGYHID